ncbi:hypothetical protein C8P68_102487 [Mucilaginibacter yixingensis]|uniref:Uncharacterized protein n=1 Tax=Mucilaginibacter yixingensis TaxID=1295612 RepID=A0A2T5JD18_9SPHI|nr:hypothetical protein [Mucilaginibacter yixingensis]PTQ99659.1 hypothetical protein C8P68_102487 [Mucilaginibacter yixingensis]
MPDRFFTQDAFHNGFGREMVSAGDVYDARSKSGMQEYSLAQYDFVFIADKQDKLERLGKFLSENYGYTIKPVTQIDALYELTGDATEFPVDESNLMYWALDLYCKGYEFDCRLDGYGASGDPQNQRFADLDPSLYQKHFDLAMDAYNNRNLGMAAIHFSTAIKINPNDPNSWYSRAIVKDELHTWKAARRDYDKAIELAPDFTDAILNRAANKDEAGEYQAAIDDYTFVINLEPQNEMAYFNRGNSKLNLKDTKGACADWHKAHELGADYAVERIEQHCNNKSSLKDKLTGLFKRN